VASAAARSVGGCGGTCRADARDVQNDQFIGIRL
jgi:hypothetical protein